MRQHSINEATGLDQAGQHMMPNYGAKVKAEKLAPIVRGWRNYHQFCKLDGQRLSLSALRKRTGKVFNKERKLNQYQVKELVNKAFPAVPYHENKFVNVKGDKSPFDGDITYWAKRNSALYDSNTSRMLKQQNHTCGYCKMLLTGEERVHLHHKDGNHNNWKVNNLMVVHESCHDYIHMSNLDCREPGAVKVARPDLTERGEG